MRSDAIGAGTRIWAFAHVLAGARIGVDCNIGDHAFVEGGATLGDRVRSRTPRSSGTASRSRTRCSSAPGAPSPTTCGPASASPCPPAPLSPGAAGRSLGASVTVVCGTTIGRYALVGAGALVTEDVADHALVVGVPARRIGWVCVCAETLDESLVCSCGRRYEPAGEGLRERA